MGFPWFTEMRSFLANRTRSIRAQTSDCGCVDLTGNK